MFLNLWVFSQEIFLKSTLPQKLNEGVVKKNKKQKKGGYCKGCLLLFFRSFQLLLGRWWVLGPSSIFRVSYTKGCWIANGWHGACGRQAWSLGNISFFSLTSTRSLLKHKFYAHYTVNSLSVPLCSVNTNTKSCFSFRQFWRQIQKKI